MTKHIILFVAAFIGGTVLALAVRSALFKPYDGHATHVDQPAPAPMVDNTAPAAPRTPVARAPDPHAGHEHAPTPAPPAEGATVNTICPICAMDVDPSIPPATYQGKQVGFGCRACPPIFARDPDRYGPAALANEVAGN